jgi:DNA polymerase
MVIFDEITRDILGCKKCELCRSRTNAVPGEGPIDAKAMFIGEGPGREEDIQGRPFVGPA